MNTVVNLVSDRPTSDLENLSFVGSNRNYWSPQRTGSYTRDCAIGRGYAEELVEFIQSIGSPIFLGHVCRAIAEGVDYGGVEVGFFHQISVHLITSAVDQEL